MRIVNLPRRFISWRCGIRRPRFPGGAPSSGRPRAACCSPPCARDPLCRATAAAVGAVSRTLARYRRARRSGGRRDNRDGPPAGSFVFSSMLHWVKAAEFRMYSWPPRMSTTGCAARRDRDRRRERQPLLLQLRLVPIAVRDNHLAGRRLADTLPDRGVGVLSDRARDRSTPGPPPAP